MGLEQARPIGLGLAVAGRVLTGPDEETGDQLRRLRGIVGRTRRECPWDAKQTHRSLVKHLIEETAEVVEAIEAGDGDVPASDADLCEELGDLLLQVFLHAEIADQQGRFTLDDVARGVADKLVRRHPWVFAGQDDPDDMMGTWESAKRAEKQRASALDGIPSPLASLARAAKVTARVRDVHLPVELADQPITPAEAGEQILVLVQRAQASGIDADQATRAALRRFEDEVRRAEASQLPG